MMKKIFALFAAVAMLFAVVSCNPKDHKSIIGFDYDIEVVGDADGIINFTYPNGVMGVNGDADLVVKFSNDTTALAPIYGQAYGLGDEFDNPEVIAAASRVGNWFEEQFSAEAVEGSYYFHITGYVKERLTGVIFAIDREFTNRKDDEIVGK